MTSFTATTSTGVLLDMLGHKRPAFSKTERRFIRQFISPLGVTADAFGNLYKRIGDAPVMWSSHTDSVHREGGKQLPYVEHGMVRLAKGSASNCLGADCAAGVWLMREMILARRPGLYVFHRAEEIGGQGSDYIARNQPHVLEGIKACIALDRRGYGDVITHQGGTRTASDDFALSLAALLGQPYAPCDGGLFTDSANYVDHIGECTNVSVGYDFEHSKSEELNVAHIVALREVLLALDTSKLVYSRQPGDFDDDWAYGTQSRSHWACDADQSPRDRMPTIVELCRDFPDEVADILEAYGLNAHEVAEEIHARVGFIRR